MSEFTDLSKPLPVDDPAKLQETMATIVRILWSKPLAVIAPYTGSVSVPCSQSTTEPVSVKQLETL